MGARHGDTAANHNSTNFFGVVDRTLTHFFWLTGWEVISKFPSHSSLEELSECEYPSWYPSPEVQSCDGSCGGVWW